MVDGKRRQLQTIRTKEETLKTQTCGSDSAISGKRNPKQRAHQWVEMKLNSEVKFRDRLLKKNLHKRHKSRAWHEFYLALLSVCLKTTRIKQ